jgi:hypothetical protein
MSISDIDDGFSGNDKERLFFKTKQIIKRLTPFIACFILLVGSRAVFYTIEPWKSDHDFNITRQNVVDYPMSEWDKIEKDHPEIDRNIYNGALKWLYADTDLINLDNLHLIESAGKRTFWLEPEILGEYLESTVLDLFFEWRVKLVPALIIVFMVICVFLKDRSRQFRLGALLSAAGAFIIIGYFIMIGRAPSRVWQAVIFAALGVLLIIFRAVPSKTDGHVPADTGHSIHLRVLDSVMILLLTAAFISGAVKDMSLHTFITPFNSKVLDDDPFEEFYGGDTRYLVCGWDEKVTEKNLYSRNLLYGWMSVENMYKKKGKLPPPVFFRYFICGGDWFSGQEYYRSLLEEIGIKNPVRALFEQDNIRLLDISEDTRFREFFFVYLYDHYGEMTVKKVGSIMGYPVYEFKRE